LTLVLADFFMASPLHAESVTFKQAVTQAAAGNKVLAAFYKTRKYEPIWMGNRGGQRRRT